MKDTVQGKITNIEAKTTSKGADMWTIHLGKMRYNCFDAELVKQFNDADFVEIDLEKHGMFWNMVAMRHITEKVSTHHQTFSREHEKGESSRNVTVPRTLTPKEKADILETSQYHLTIEQVRLGALDCAIKVTKKLGTDDYTADLMRHAVEFEEYILTGKVAT